MRILVLHTDSFGGQGGIAKFNRDLLTALTTHPATERVTALPRYILEAVGTLPPKLEFRARAARSKLSFLMGELSLLPRRRWFDLVICGHPYLLPLLLPLQLRSGARQMLVIHGTDAWDPLHRSGFMTMIARLDRVLSVSAYTRDRFAGWSGIRPERCFVIPNAVDLGRFTPGPKSPALVARYRLGGKRVLMGLARLNTTERYKGIDEVIEAMPALRLRHPDLAYLVCGDGSDRARLEAKAKALGLGEHVIFTGYIDEAEKVDHYRLADCFLLAGWGEGFGIVLLEAMACGVPVVASTLDASQEAVENGRLGVVVDPHDGTDLMRGIEQALARPRGVVPAGLEAFSYRAFEERIHRMVLDPIARGDKL